jgi:hypothetical protein
MCYIYRSYAERQSSLQSGSDYDLIVRGETALFIVIE